MKRILISLAFQMSVAHAIASDISLRIVDASGVVIPNGWVDFVQVSEKSAQVRRLELENGEIRLPIVGAAQEYRLVISAVGFIQRELQLEVNADVASIVTISLQSGQLHIGEPLKISGFFDSRLAGDGVKVYFIVNSDPGQLFEANIKRNTYEISVSRTGLYDVVVVSKKQRWKRTVFILQSRKLDLSPDTLSRWR